MLSFAPSITRLSLKCSAGNQENSQSLRKCAPSAPCCVSRRKLMQSSIALSAALLPFLPSEAAEDIAELDLSNDRPTINFKRFFADSMENDMKLYEERIAERKKTLFQNHVPKGATLLDIGLGSGPNLKYLPRDTRVVGLEPNKFMWAYSEEKAKTLGLSLTLQEAFAESIPMPDASCDTVVSTLTLCSVKSPSDVVDEIGRVLKPGGYFLFVEHTLAPSSKPIVRAAQNILNPVQNFLAEGCNLNRDTEGLIRKKGELLFDEVEVDRFEADFGTDSTIGNTLVTLVRPHIAGYARRSKNDT